MEVKREHAEERAEVHSRSAPDLAERLMSASASGGAELGEKAQRTNTGADMPWAQGCAGLGPLLTGPHLVGPFTSAQVLEYYRLGEEKRKDQRIKELKAYHTSIGSTLTLWDDKPPLPGFPMPKPVTVHMTRGRTAAIGPHPTAEEEFWRIQNELDVRRDREQHPEFTLGTVPRPPRGGCRQPPRRAVPARLLRYTRVPPSVARWLMARRAVSGPNARPLARRLALRHLEY